MMCAEWLAVRIIAMEVLVILTEYSIEYLVYLEVVKLMCAE